MCVAYVFIVAVPMFLLALLFNCVVHVTMTVKVYSIQFYCHVIGQQLDHLPLWATNESGLSVKGRDGGRKEGRGDLTLFCLHLLCVTQCDCDEVRFLMIFGGILSF